MDHAGSSPFARDAWCVALLALLAFVNAIDAGFVYDDQAFVVTNASVIDGAGIFTEPTPPQRPDLGLYRPLTVSTYWIQNAIHGLAPVWFHAVNVLLHALVSVLVLRVGRQFFAARAAALSAALLFAVHPIHVEAVAWIVGRAELLAAAFALTAILVHGRPTAAHSGRRSCGAAALYALACLSKETALTLPAALFAFDVVFRDGAPWSRIVARQVPHAVACVALYGIRIAALGHFVPDPTLPDLAHVQETARGALFLGVCGRWLTSLVFPTGASVYYAAARFVEPAAMLMGLIALALVVFVGVVAWRRRSRPLACGLALGIVAALPFLQIVPIGAVFGDRFVYFGSVGFAFVLAALLPLDAAGTAARRVARTFVALAVLVGVTATWLRNPAFHDDLALWKDAIAAAPQEAHPHFQVGQLYFERGQLEYQSADLKGAVFHLTESLRIDPKHEWAGSAHVTLGECAAGKRGDPLQKHVDAFTAADHYRAAIPLLGADPTDALLNLAALHRTQAVDEQEARIAIDAVLRIARDAKSVENARAILAEVDADAAREH